MRMGTCKRALGEWVIVIAVFAQEKQIAVIRRRGCCRKATQERRRIAAWTEKRPIAQFSSKAAAEGSPNLHVQLHERAAFIAVRYRRPRARTALTTARG